MRDRNLLDEAEACRQLAFEFIGRSEVHFLVRAAAAFEELALRPLATIATLIEKPSANTI